jgi:CheY-like chemotaxis protein
VEDEAIIALDLKAQLEELGYCVVAISQNGLAALAAVEQHKPALVLMDIRLTGPIDGIETAELIRRDFGTPVVYLTSFSDKETVRRASVTTPCGYLVKPISTTDLQDAIKLTLERTTDRTRWKPVLP